MYREDEWHGYSLAHTKLGKVRYKVKENDSALTLIAYKEDGGLTLQSGRTYFIEPSSYEEPRWYYNGMGFQLTREGICAHYMKTPRTRSRYLHLEDDDAAEINECLREAYDGGAFDRAPQLDPVQVAEVRKQSDEYRDNYILLLKSVEQFNSFVTTNSTPNNRYGYGMQKLKLKYQY